MLITDTFSCGVVQTVEDCIWCFDHVREVGPPSAPMIRLFIAALVITLTSPGMPFEWATATAQTDGTMRLILRGDSPISDPLLGGFIVEANGVECLSVTIAPSATEAEVVIGEPGQPEVCRQEGAMLTFFRGDRIQLFVTGEFRGGTSLVLENFAPIPPQTGIGTPAPGTTGHGVLSDISETPRTLGRVLVAFVALLLVFAGRAVGTWRRA